MASANCQNAATESAIRGPFITSICVIAVEKAILLFRTCEEKIKVESKKKMAAFGKKEAGMLKAFVAACKANPSLIHQPELEFFKEYITSLGG